MQQKTLSYIQQNNLANLGTPILVACSGGVDSMVLVNVLLNLEFKISIAHCNFQLRGEDSDGDEHFIKDFAKQYALPFYSVRFDTKEHKKENRQSTQMAARELRYQWLEQIRKENQLHAIVTAHHLDDQLETVLLNLTKGTGLKGLNGMRPKNGYIIRPFLEISKNEIVQYAHVNNIAFREDISNASDDYQRNQLRHHVVPVLQKINPALYNTTIEFIQKIHDYDILFEEHLALIKKKCWSEKNGIVEIKMGFIKAHRAGKTILFHLLKDFGFNTDQVQQLLNSWQTKETSGKQFFSEAYRLVLDRNSAFVLTKDTALENYILLEKIPQQIVFNQYKIKCTLVPIQELNMKQSSRYAYIDAAKINFPLMLRFSKEGDYFYPIGMSKPKMPGKVGKKKLSKYFKDEKFSLIEKENTPVLFSGGKMVWLVNHRLDDRFKVTEHTKQVLKMVIVDGYK